jgi:hypothetical protein
MNDFAFTVRLLLVSSTGSFELLKIGEVWTGCGTGGMDTCEGPKSVKLYSSSKVRSTVWGFVRKYRRRWDLNPFRV